MREKGKLPVPNFAAGGIATPADAALCMQLGAEAIFVGSGIFKSSDPEKRARAIVKATTHWRDAEALLAAEESLGSGMKGIEAASLPEEAAAPDARMVTAPRSARAGKPGESPSSPCRATSRRTAARSRRSASRASRPDGPADLERAGGLSCPGGESTTLWKFFEGEPWEEAFRSFAGSGRPVLGTCAGAILLAREVTHPAQKGLGLIDIAIERNAYGRQVDSFRRRRPVPRARSADARGLHPRAEDPRASVPASRSSASLRGEPVLVRAGQRRGGDVPSRAHAPTGASTRCCSRRPPRQRRSA